MYFVLQIGAHATECILNFEERRQLFKLCTSMQFLTNVFLFQKIKFNFFVLATVIFCLIIVHFMTRLKEKKS